MAQWKKTTEDTEQIAFVDNLSDSFKSENPIYKKKDETQKRLNSLRTAIIILYVIVTCMLIVLLVKIVMPGKESKAPVTGIISKQTEDMEDAFRNLKGKVGVNSDSLTKVTRNVDILTEKLSLLKDTLSSLSSLESNIPNLNADIEQLKNTVDDKVNYTISIVQTTENTLQDMRNSIDDMKNDVNEIRSTIMFVNSTCMGDISIHTQNIDEVTSVLRNVSATTESLEEKHIRMAAEIKLEMVILKNITEDLRLKDWEHSLALNNITVIQGPPGAKGVKGDQGDRGSPGPAGRMGNPGRVGPKGNKGEVGRGIPGFPGMRGIPGQKGEKGESGIQDLHSLTVNSTLNNSTVRVRLVNGLTPRQGRVEVYHEGQWGTICDDKWDITDGSVVCKMLGFQRADRVYTHAYFGRGIGNILLDEVSCTGKETSIFDCQSSAVGKSDCTHSEDAGVSCTT
ncbi:macrophage scavenger receptor types I and II isoform X2 [Amia ocellicauda]|uniref:macrophage scavenger receptor types I and II isoform X2 n=1 Tax=Amia ocellicauda TaxID=2972642 RepID=UPI00346469FD